ncbi:HNH endonuclease [Streptomyces phage Hank144]|uniref:HNH endonuclease n=1 Tax=Streptomyces phage Hank144 TaxID=2301573 RepID=A0A385DR75_9CAUD|nr:HNH endonuclease [Streptomyces phage Hank144]AXQ61109.1 HNH endonuclease [Streptomyces phage Hank144]
MERWIPGREGQYAITQDGVTTSYVRGKPRVLKWKIGTDGYPRVAIAQKWVPVHTLILEAWAGPRPDGMVVRHLNGDPMKPHLSQLAWGTQSENLRDKRAHGTDHNVNKTHCPKGHEYTEANTLRRADRPGHRACRTCNRDAVARSRQRKRQGVAP